MPQENRLLDAAREAVNSLGLSDFKGVMRELFHKPYQNGFDLRLHENYLANQFKTGHNY